MEEYKVDSPDCICSDILALVACRIGMWITWYTALFGPQLIYRMVKVHITWKLFRNSNMFLLN